MSGSALSGYLVPVALAISTAGFSAAGMQFLGADPAAMRSPDSTEPMDPPEIPLSSPPDLMSEEAIRRPVFHRERSPIDDPGKAPVAIADAPPDTDQAAGPPAFELRGVVIVDGAARAGLLPPGTSELTWVTRGQDINGWTVESITANAVNLKSGDETATISIVREAR